MTAEKSDAIAACKDCGEVALLVGDDEDKRRCRSCWDRFATYEITITGYGQSAKAKAPSFMLVMALASSQSVLSGGEDGNALSLYEQMQQWAILGASIVEGYREAGANPDQCKRIVDELVAVIVRQGSR